MTEHTVKAYGEELDSLSADIARMGGIAESMVADSVASIIKRDAALARSVVERDPRVDAIQRDVERKILRVFALRQPMARDLRETLSALKLANDIERIGDLAKNIAKRTLVLHEDEPIALARGVERMGRIAAINLQQVLDAYSGREVRRAVNVWFQDEELDEHYNSVFRELLTYMMEDPRTIGPCAHLLFIAKNIERIGDHCTNMAEIIHFLITGEEMATERPKAEDALSMRISSPEPKEG
jgi:phosphate transport system protein